MKVGNRVTRARALHTNHPTGSIIKINNDYIVVDWDNLPGDWHYTHEQAQKLTIVTLEDVDK